MFQKWDSSFFKSEWWIILVNTVYSQILKHSYRVHYWHWNCALIGFVIKFSTWLATQEWRHSGPNPHPLLQINLKAVWWIVASPRAFPISYHYRRFLSLIIISSNIHRKILTILETNIMDPTFNRVLLELGKTLRWNTDMHVLHVLCTYCALSYFIIIVDYYGCQVVVIHIC